MKLIPVESSTIARYGWARRTLHIVFKNGRIYRYFDVPPRIADHLAKAESKGRYFNTFIKDLYRYERVYPDGKLKPKRRPK